MLTDTYHHPKVPQQRNRRKEHEKHKKNGHIYRNFQASVYATSQDLATKDITRVTVIKKRINVHV